MPPLHSKSEQEIAALKYDLNCKTQQLADTRRKLEETTEQVISAAAAAAAGNNNNEAGNAGGNVQELCSKWEATAKLFESELQEEHHRNAIKNMFFGRGTKASHVTCRTSVQDAAKALVNLGDLVEHMCGFDTADTFFTQNHSLNQQINDANTKAVKLLGPVAGWGFPVLRKGELNEDKATKSILAKYIENATRKPNIIQIDKILHDLKVLVNGNYEIEDEDADQPASGPRIMTQRSWENAGEPLITHRQGEKKLVKTHRAFQQVERKFGHGALQAVQDAMMEREDSQQASGGYGQAYDDNFKEK
eukprot:COSAG01_NODE_9749_length_2355_cov_1.400266_2_plen_304_part_01